MITAFRIQDGVFKLSEVRSEQEMEGAYWLDLKMPLATEIQQVQSAFQLTLPTREEMEEIEPSDRLYTDGAAVYLTVSLIVTVADESPRLQAVTFILTKNTLITIRHAEFFSFKNVVSQLRVPTEENDSAEALFACIFEGIVDRVADLLESTVRRSENLTAKIFKYKDDKKITNLELMRDLGRLSDTASAIRESLSTLFRAVVFARTRMARKPTIEPRLNAVSADLTALNEQSNFVATKLQFALDATLGMINIEQNDIIKIFSVVAVIFMPPTMIASIYGMNFEVMPELKFTLGYPFVLLIMLASAICPFLYFKRKKWL